MKPKRVRSGKHVRARGGAKVKRSPRGLLLAAIGVIVVLILVVYFTIASSYKGRFLGRTTINGLNCSGKTVQEVNTAMNLQAKNYVLTLKEREGKTETINGGDIDLTYVDNGQVAELLDGISPYGWLWSQIRGTELTVQANMSYDETKFETVISHLSAFNPAYAEAPTDAQIVPGDTQFQIQKESEGRELDNEKALKLIQEGIKTGVTEIDFEDSECYKKPSVYENDQNLKEQLEKVNGYLKAKITYDFEDRTIEVTAQDIMAMIAQDDKGNYGLDQTKVKEFVTTKLAYATDTFGLTHTVKCHDGKTRKLTGGDYGWCINRDKTTEELIPLLESGAEKKIEPVYLYSAKSRAKDDIGGTYVEISISDQHLWCYKDYKLVTDTDVVTGNISKGNGTPKGSVWAIDAKKSPAVLGTIETMGYSSPVTYWMPYCGNVGMHDADGWRHEYGGKIYKTNGSHGCVNMPKAAARIVYNTLESGSAVVVY